MKEVLTALYFLQVASLEDALLEECTHSRTVVTMDDSRNTIGSGPSSVVVLSQTMGRQWMIRYDRRDRSRHRDSWYGVRTHAQDGLCVEYLLPASPSPNLM